jgi:hypothetical protein
MTQTQGYPDSLPHMCRNEHVEIRHGLSDEWELCPLCHTMNALSDLILLCKREGFDATAEYNGAWTALARAAGRDEIEFRRAFTAIERDAPVKRGGIVG